MFAIFCYSSAISAPIEIIFWRSLFSAIAPLFLLWSDVFLTLTILLPYLRYFCYVNYVSNHTTTALGSLSRLPITTCFSYFPDRSLVTWGWVLWGIVGGRSRSHVPQQQQSKRRPPRGVCFCAQINGRKKKRMKALEWSRHNHCNTREEGEEYKVQRIKTHFTRRRILGLWGSDCKIMQLIFHLCVWECDACPSWLKKEGLFGLPPSSSFVFARLSFPEHFPRESSVCAPSKMHLLWCFQVKKKRKRKEEENTRDPE